MLPPPLRHALETLRLNASLLLHECYAQQFALGMGLSFILLGGLWGYISPAAAPLLWPLLKTFIVTLLLLLTFPRSIPLTLQRLMVAFLCLTLGGALGSLIPAPERIPRYQDGAFMQMPGKVLPVEKGFAFETDQLHTRTPVRLALHNVDDAALTPGENTCLLGTLKLPHAPRFQGDFNEAAYLRGQGLQGRFIVSKIVREDCFIPPPVERPPLRERVMQAWFRLNAVLQSHRADFVTTLKAALGEEKGSLLGGVVLGDRASPLAPSLKQAFLATGQIHLVAASGMNIAIIAGGLLFLLGLFPKVPRLLQFGLASVGVLCYGVATGFPPSILRAGAMWFGGLWVKYAFKPLKPLFLLILAVTILLLLMPQLAFSLGFQLSALTTFGILAGLPYFEAALNAREKNIFQRLGFAVLASGILTALAQLYATPLLIHTFGTLTPYSILMNMLSGLLVVPLTLLGFISYGLSFLHAGVAYWLPKVLLELPLSAMVSWTQWGAALPGAEVQVAAPGEGWLLGCYALLLTLPWVLRYARPRRRLLYGVGYTFAGLCLALWPFWNALQLQTAQPRFATQTLVLEGETIHLFHLKPKPDATVQSIVFIQAPLTSWQVRDLAGYFEAKRLPPPGEVLYLSSDFRRHLKKMGESPHKTQGLNRQARLTQRLQAELFSQNQEKVFGLIEQVKTRVLSSIALEEKQLSAWRALTPTADGVHHLIQQRAFRVLAKNGEPQMGAPTLPFPEASPKVEKPILGENQPKRLNSKPSPRRKTSATLEEAAAIEALESLLQNEWPHVKLTTGSRHAQSAFCWHVATNGYMNLRHLDSSLAVLIQPERKKLVAYFDDIPTEEWMFHYIAPFSAYVDRSGRTYL